MKVERISALLLAVGCITAGFVGCSDDTNNGTGGTTASSTTSSSVSTGAVSSSSTGGQDPFIGIECTGDDQCGSMGICIRSGDTDARLGGGPAGGYCSKSCTSSGECGQGNYCWEDAGGAGLCFLGCEIGDPSLDFINTPLADDKCRAREDLRCDQIEGVSVCVPTCGSDTQCDGRACDPRLAVCVDTPNPGLPNGDACMIQGSTDPCAGLCVNFSIVNMCTSYCVLGGEVQYPDCGGLDKGICAYTATDPVGAGDIGLCAKACLKHDDCLNPNLWCVGIGNLTGPVIPNGFCFGGADACPNGQNQCQPGDTCTNTPYGPYCLDATFPLSDQGTGGAGGGSGTGGGGTGGAGTGGTGGTGG